MTISTNTHYNNSQPLKLPLSLLYGSLTSLLTNPFLPYLHRHSTTIMSTILPSQLNPTPKLIHYSRLPNLIRSAATAPPKPRRLTAEPLLLGTQIVKPNKIRTPVLNDPTLKSNWSHRAWITSGCTTVLISLAKSASLASESHIWLEPILAGLFGYIMADLGSGLYHFGIDNYGGPKTPIVGSQIEAFQGHHKWPWTITRREFANNLHALARAVTFTVLPLNLLIDDPVLLGFVGVCSGGIMFSQQFHAWAHTTKSKLPPMVVALQDGGLLVSRSQHAAHHRAPYNNNYCIVSGIWNEVLDNSRFFEVLEMVIFFRFGVRPRSWDEPNLEWMEETESASLGST